MELPNFDGGDIPMENQLLSWREALEALEQAKTPLRETASQQTESERWEKEPEHQKTIAFYTRYIEQYPEARVLDLGAGSGKVALRVALLDNVVSLIAHDMSAEAMMPLIEGVRHRIQKEPSLEKIRFSCDGQPWELPFNDNMFDVIICRYAMHHFADQPGTVHEIWRCLCSDGIFLYSDPAMPEHSRDTTHKLYRLREDFFHGYRTYHEMIDLVRDPGFEILAMRPYDYQRGTLDHYLRAAHPELKDDLIHAWCGLDEKTKRELKWSGKPDGPFINVPENKKEIANRHYNDLMLEISNADQLLRRIGETVVNEVAASLVHNVADASFSEYIWNELTTAYYKGESHFGVNPFIAGYDTYLRDLLFYFDAAKDYMADQTVEKFIGFVETNPDNREIFRVLEPGAGSGDILFRVLDRLADKIQKRELRPEGVDRFHYTGFDLSEDMLKGFEKRKSQKQYQVAKIRSLLARVRMYSGDAIKRDSWPEEIQHSSFDLVAVVFMLHHVYPPKRWQFMEDLCRVGTSGTWFLFLETTEEHKWFKPYHDPQDVEPIEYFEPFHKVFDGFYVSGVKLCEQQFFPPIEIIEPDDRLKTSGWAVASIGTIR
jgi:SAM-dependent methyltransferase